MAWLWLQYEHVLHNQGAGGGSSPLAGGVPVSCDIELLLGQVEGNVGDEVFLSTDESALPDGDEDVAGVETVGLGGCFGVA